MKNKESWAFLIGAFLFFEGIFIQTDFSQYGIPSLVIGGFQIHHWMIGLFLMFLVVLSERNNS